MLFDFGRLIMILAPACPPAKEVTAAGKINRQMIFCHGGVVQEVGQGTKAHDS